MHTRPSHLYVRNAHTHTRARALTINTEKNKKRDIRNWYQSVNDRYNDAAVEDKNRDDLRRGDIPIIHGDCDGMLYLHFLFSNNKIVRLLPFLLVLLACYSRDFLKFIWISLLLRCIPVEISYFVFVVVVLRCACVQISSPSPSRIYWRW